MSVIGFTYNKIQVDKKQTGKGQIKVSHQIGFDSVEEQKLALGKNSTQALKFIFGFTLNYDPNVGNMKLGGELTKLVNGDAEKIAAEWKKTKKLPPELLSEVMNEIFRRSIIYTIMLAREVNLPSPVPLPKLSVEQKKE